MDLMGSGGSRFHFYSSVTDARGQKKQHDEGFSRGRRRTEVVFTELEVSQ